MTRPRPLGQQLFVAALLAVFAPLAAMLTLGLWQYHRESTGLEQLTATQSVEMARIAAGIVDAMLGNTERTLGHLADTAVQTKLTDAQLADAVRGEPYVMTMSLVGPDGRVLASSRPGASRPPVTAQLATLAGGARVAYSEVYRDGATGERVFAICEPVRRDGRLVGAIVAEPSVKRIGARFLGRLEMASRSFTYLTDRRGRVIAHPDNALVEGARDLSANPPVKAALAGATGWLDFDSPLTGTPRLAAYTTVPRTGWAVVSSWEAPVEVLDPARRFREQALVVVLAALVGGLLAIGWGRRLARPMEALAAAMGHARDVGLHKEPFPVLEPTKTESPVTELETVATTYNALVEELSRRFQEIIVFQEELQAQNEELYLQQEELQAQNEELEFQAEQIAQQNEQLAEQIAFGGLLLGAVNEGVCGLDPNGKVTFANAAAATILRQDIDAMRGRDFRPFYRQGAHVPASPAEAERFFRADGSSFPVRATCGPLRQDGSQAGEVVVFSDLTPRLEAERAVRLETERKAAVATAQMLAARNEELERLSAAAEAANKLKSEFLASMSHELRTPLNSIIGYTELVLMNKKAPIDGRNRSNLDVVLRNAQHLLALINDVLDLAKVEAGRAIVHPEPVDPAALLAAVKATVAPLATEKGLALTVEVAPGLDWVVTDETKLRQVVINLATNAIKFTHQGGVTIVASATDAEHWRIAVCDTGIGIAPEHQALVFESFRQVDSSATREVGGTGLGLAIARRLARLLGGDITLESKRGLGSTFTLDLPRSWSNLPGAGATEVVTAPLDLPADKDIVLAIDDDPEVLRLIGEQLEDSGYAVVTARSGVEGLQLARALKPYAITLDLIMPEMDGWRLLRELRNDPVTRSIPVVVLSVVDQKLHGAALGATTFLPKPAQRARLLAALDGVSAGRAGVDREVLVVDDDPEARGMIRQLLADDHIHVAEAANGAEAIDAIRRRSPDLVVLDLMMPVVDGFAVVAWLRSRPETRDLPVVVVTARDLEDEEIRQLPEVRRIVQKGGLDLKLLEGNLRALLDGCRAAAGGAHGVA